MGADPSGLPGGTSVGTILISQPGSDNVTPVKVTLQETITVPTLTVTTNPPNLNFVCNRTTYTAPHTFINPATPFYCEGATTVQTIAPGTRALFSGWSDGYAGVVRKMDAPANQTLTILYRLQNEVSISVNPTCGGTVVPSHFWYNPGTLATSMAKPEGSFEFVNYSGDLSFTDPALKFPVSGPVNLVANFKCTNCDALTSQPAAINLASHLSLNAHIASANPADRIQFIVDPDLPPWLSVSASSPTIPTNLTVKADVSAQEAGSHNTSITLHPVNLPAGASVPDLIIPVTLGVVDVAVDSVPSGLNVIVDNVTYTAPAQFKWVSGSEHRLNAATQIVGNAKYVPGAWSDGGAAFHVVTAPAPGALVSYTDDFAAYYQLALKADPPGGGNVKVVNPAPDGFYLNGSSVSVQARANPGFRFAEFSGSVSGTTNPVSLSVNNYVLELANFNSATGPALRVTPPGQWLILPFSNTVSGTFQIANVSTSGVGNVTITGVDSFKTVAGAGTVSLISQGSVYIAAFPPGASFPFQLQFNWPASAHQVQMTVHFSGDGAAYAGQTTLTLTR